MFTALIFGQTQFFNVYSPWNFSVITQDSELEFGHVYIPYSVIFFGYLN